MPSSKKGADGLTSVGASLTQVQDNNQVAALPSLVSGSQQMDTSRVGAASLTKVQNSTQMLVQISLSPGYDNSWAVRRTDEVSPGRRLRMQTTETTTISTNTVVSHQISH